MVVIATATRYSSLTDPRFSMAVKFVENAVLASIPVVVIDESPDANVSEYLRSSGAIVIRAQNPTMGVGRRMAIGEALKISGDKTVIVWSEPEKYPLIKFIPKIAKPILNGEADMVIPRRQDDLDSYPTMQKHAELFGNYGLLLLTGVYRDMWFGPRAFNAKVAEYFLAYDGTSADRKKNYGDRWDSIFIPVLRALSKDVRTVEVSIDYQHPPEQTASEVSYEFYEKRLLQLNTLLEAMKYEAKLLGFPH